MSDLPQPCVSELLRVDGLAPTQLPTAMAKAATDGIQKVYVMRPTREDQIRETAVRLFIASPGADPKEAADRAIERAIAFEEVWRQAKETGRLEAPQLDDELFTP